MGGGRERPRWREAQRGRVKKKEKKKKRRKDGVPIINVPGDTSVCVALVARTGTGIRQQRKR